MPSDYVRSIVFRPEVLKYVERLAKEERRSRSFIVNDLIEPIIQPKEPPKKGHSEIVLDSDVGGRIERLAKANNRSKNELVNECLRQLFELMDGQHE